VVGRLGVLGGTFDPIHNAHLRTASEAARRMGLDEVIFMPAGWPWQKDLAMVTSREDRYSMTRLAVSAIPDFSVSRMEIDRAGPSFTVDTVRELRDLHGDAVELYMIAGADIITSIFGWRDATLLFELANFAFCSRAGFPLAQGSLPNHRTTLLHTTVREVSSTLIRGRVRRGESIRHLVPAVVADYIQDRGLYRAAIQQAG
jgi:nicotinate-nucleotide adenylyltransferase